MNWYLEDPTGRRRIPEPPDQPPEPALCVWCDGRGQVDVAMVYDVDGHEQRLTDKMNDKVGEINCPRCDGTGEEPLPDLEDDPRVP